MAVLRQEKSVARFERVAVFLSGGGGLGAYQAGALASLDASGCSPNWLAANSIGALNAAVIAGSPTGQRGGRLGVLWRRLGALVAQRSRRSLLDRALRHVVPFRHIVPNRPSPLGATGLDAVETMRLRALLAELVDFSRINSGAVRLTLASQHLPTGTETYFDNDRQVLTVEHVLASAALPAGLSPIWIDGESYGGDGAAVAPGLPALLDSLPPADTLCFFIDCYDPAPPGAPSASRAGQQIAALRRCHDLRRIIGLLGERLPPDLQGDPDIRRYLAQGSRATVNLVHLVHESSAINLVDKLADFSPAGIEQRWRAGERDMAASLGRPAWLSPSPRRVGLVVHELRSGHALRPSH